MIAIHFGLLGPVEVLVDGGRRVTMAPRHRAILAYLLLNAGVVVSAKRLTEAMWGLTPPDSARSQLQASVATVRRVLREAGAGEVVLTRPGGYLVQPVSGSFDVAEFDHAATQARALPAGEAVLRLRAALASWRGEPLADIDADYVPSARARLANRRIAVFELLMDFELALGRHEVVLEELAAEIERHPMREKLCGQYMLTLHRCGRQADALEFARAYRMRLVEERGLDPGREFTALEQAVRRDDAKLTAVPPRRANFLPYDIPDFAGRTAELERLMDIPGQAAPGGVVAISAIDGMAGVGKTTLAVHIGHRLAPDFPDGQLFVDLRAHTAGRPRVDAGAALETLLLQLGVPVEQIPASIDARAARWRAELADRRVLAILDNAADADHVRPLLPGAAGCLVVVTSRRRILDLDGARSLSLEVFSLAEAFALFRGVVGERAEKEPRAVMDVLELCGFLPLAVRIAAARLHYRPQWSVEYLADRLRDERRRLTELSTSERSVAAAFALSYQQFRPDKKRMFRLLGLNPGTDITAEAAAALADLPVDRAEGLLEELLDAHVLLQRTPGRYTMHDLLREHARSVAVEDESAEDRHRAVHRLADFYLHTIAAAVEIQYPDTKHRRRAIPATSLSIAGFADARAAKAWFDDERANFLAVGAHAADNGLPEHTIHISELVWRYLMADGQYDAIELYRRSVAASRLIGDPVGEARAQANVGNCLLRLSQFRAAEPCFAEAAALAAKIGDVRAEAEARVGLNRARRVLHDFIGAEAAARRGLELYQDAGDRYGQVGGLTQLALNVMAQGRFAEANEHQRSALALAQAIESPISIALVRGNSGVILHREGRQVEAREQLRQGLELYREMSHRRGEVVCLNFLGLVATALGEPAEALVLHEAALDRNGEGGEPLESGHAHAGLASAQRALGHMDLARAHAEKAFAWYSTIGVPEAAAMEELLAVL